MEASRVPEEITGKAFESDPEGSKSFDSEGPKPR